MQLPSLSVPGIVQPEQRRRDSTYIISISHLLTEIDEKITDEHKTRKRRGLSVCARWSEKKRERER